MHEITEAFEKLKTDVNNMIVQYYQNLNQIDDLKVQIESKNELIHKLREEIFLLSALKDDGSSD